MQSMPCARIPGQRLIHATAVQMLPQQAFLLWKATCEVCNTFGGCYKVSPHCTYSNMAESKTPSHLAKTDCSAESLEPRKSLTQWQCLLYNKQATYRAGSYVPCGGSAHQNRPPGSRPEQEGPAGRRAAGVLAQEQTAPPDHRPRPSWWPWPPLACLIRHDEHSLAQQHETSSFRSTHHERLQQHHNA